MPEDLRAALDAAIERREWSRALALADRCLRATPSIGTAQLVLDRMRRIDDPRPRARIRLAILRSFTLEPVLPLLRAAALLHGLELEVWTGGFGTSAQELLDPGAGLDAFQPDAVLLAVQARDLAPDLWEGFAELEPAARTAAVEDAAGRLDGWIAAFRARSQ